MFTLEEVVTAFELWRSKRKHRKERIPEALWDMAMALLPYHKKSEICGALRISGNRLNGRQKIFCPQTTLDQTGDNFAIGQFDPEPFQEGVCELTLKGLHKSLHMKVPMQQVGYVLSQVAGYL